MPPSLMTAQLRRGVHVAPWMGPNDELILVAVTSTGRQAAPSVIVPHGTDRLKVSDALWDLLDEVDPDIRAHLKIG
jgi:hypothetical protein